MAANPALFEEPGAHHRQGGRSWASTVPYDLLDSGDVVDVRPGKSAAAPARARAAQAVPRADATRATGTLTYAPARPTTSLAPETDLWRPAPAATSRLSGEESAALARSKARLGLYAVLAAVAVVVLYTVVSSVVHWTQVRLDDLAYGRPRTTHLDAVVGHGDSAAQPTHFIAVNLNRQVSIIEIPGGDISKAVAISGPYLFGEGEDLTPVKLRLADLNGDARPDLLVDVKSEQMAYINDADAFRPITPDEKTQFEQAALQSATGGR